MSDDELEKLYNEQEPYCNSCGWFPAFHELTFYELEPGTYRASCVSKDDSECDTHRGHYLYAMSKIPPKIDIDSRSVDAVNKATE